MLLGGEPVGERFIEWNFVSSSQERIEQAKADWRAGRMKLPYMDDKEFIPLPAGPTPPAPPAARRHGQRPRPIATSQPEQEFPAALDADGRPPYRSRDRRRSAVIACLERLVDPATAQRFVHGHQRCGCLRMALREAVLDRQRITFCFQHVDEVGQSALEPLAGQVRRPFAGGGGFGQQVAAGLGAAVGNQRTFSFLERAQYTRFIRGQVGIRLCARNLDSGGDATEVKRGPGDSPARCCRYQSRSCRAHRRWTRRSQWSR